MNVDPAGTWENLEGESKGNRNAAGGFEIRYLMQMSTAMQQTKTRNIQNTFVLKRRRPE